MHHFVLTVPRKHADASPSGSPTRTGGGVGGRREGSAPGGGGGGGGGSNTRNNIKKGLRGGVRDGKRGPFPLAVDKENNLVLHAACATVWRRVDTPPAGDGGGGKKKVGSTSATTGADIGAGSDDDGSGAGSGNPATVAYLPRCVCAMSFDPLFDTLRAVALARGGFPEAGRALMVGTGGSEGSGGGGVAGSGGGGGGTTAMTTVRSGNTGGSALSGGKIRVKTGGVPATGKADARKVAKWGLGDAATLQAAPFPLPIFFPPSGPAAVGPRWPGVPEAGSSPLTPASLKALPQQAPIPARPTLVQTASAPESVGGWRSEAAGSGSGSVGGGGWSSFGLAPLMPLDHPVEPLFQVRHRTRRRKD